MPRKVSSLTGKESQKGIGGCEDKSANPEGLSDTLEEEAKWKIQEAGRPAWGAGFVQETNPGETMVTSTGEGMGNRAGGGINSLGVRTGALGGTIWLWKVAEKEKSRTPRCLA